MFVLCQNEDECLWWRKRSFFLVMVMCVGLLWQCGPHTRRCSSYDDCLSGEICGKNQACVFDSYKNCGETGENLFSSTHINPERSDCSGETQVIEWVRHTSGCWKHETRRCGLGQLCYKKNDKESCYPGCRKNADCPQGTVCQYIENNNVAQCQNNNDRPTLDTLCYAEFKTATVIPCSSGWDIFSGPDTKLVVKIPDADDFLIPPSTDTCDLVWNKKTPEYRYAQIARMVISLYDSDGEIAWNDDDLIATWEPPGGHWLVANGKSQSFDLTATNGTLTFDIHCK